MPTIRIALIAPLLLFFMAGAGPAMAGAWPREAGTGFVASAVRLGWPRDADERDDADTPFTYSTLYIEYGLNERFTLELDLGQPKDGEGKALIGLRLPVRPRENGPKIAAALSLGKIGDAAILRPSLSLGWGLASGWVSVDSMAEIDLDADETNWKMDVTWGHALEKDRKLILQLQLTAPPDGDPAAKLETSFVTPVGARMHLEAGTIFGLSEDETVGIKLGFWTRF